MEEEEEEGETEEGVRFRASIRRKDNEYKEEKLN